MLQSTLKKLKKKTNNCDSLYFNCICGQDMPKLIFVQIMLNYTFIPTKSRKVCIHKLSYCTQNLVCHWHQAGPGVHHLEQKPTTDSFQTLKNHTVVWLSKCSFLLLYVNGVFICPSLQISGFCLGLGQGDKHWCIKVWSLRQHRPGNHCHGIWIILLR